MKKLIENGYIYIAQPPLFEIKVKGQRKSEYILSENQMRKRLISRGLEGTGLVIKGDKTQKKAKKPQAGRGRSAKGKTKASNGTREVSDKELTELVKTLAEAERIKPMMPPLAAAMAS